MDNKDAVLRRHDIRYLNTIIGLIDRKAYGIHIDHFIAALHSAVRRCDIVFAKHSGDISGTLELMQRRIELCRRIPQCTAQLISHQAEITAINYLLDLSHDMQTLVPQVIYTNYYDYDGFKMDNLLKEFEQQGIACYSLVPGQRDYPVAKAINRSHKKIVEWAKNNKLPRVCIMEDDVMFPNPGDWQRFLTNIPEDFDLYLAGIYGRNYNDQGDLVSFTGLHCYIVHERFYDRYLSAPDDVNPDIALNGLGKYIVCKPFAALQRPGYSANNNGPVDYSSMLQEGDL